MRKTVVLSLAGLGLAAFATPTEPQWARVVCSNDWSAWIDSRALKDA